ncbi:MAG: DegT/DnrJ/EryC1/StrS family aminotransferase [Planctomycetota bacterium]|nr:DegT/DnrJ/EryC1/StrS family aminotransferase [Planctomycetota bacterium]
MTTTASSKLAIKGGPRSVPTDMKWEVWPPITADDEAMVLASLRQNAHAWGPNCTALQDEWAAWNGNKFCAATNSGTAALHMGVAACDIGAGDEIITTTLSWTSSATSILHHNAIPIFVDVEWRTMLIDPAKIEAAISPKTKAILPVHYWGVPCDMDAIMDIAKRKGLMVIEDACQAHGSLYKGKKVGTFGHCSAFSLNQNKNLCGGEGGMYVTDNEELYVKGRALMNFGEMRAPESKRDFHAYGMGWMYRTSDLPAAFARAQLKSLTKNNATAVESWNRLDKGLEGSPNLVRPFSTKDQSTNGYAYVIRPDPAYAKKRGVKLGALRDGIVSALAAEGVPMGAARWLLPAHTVFQAKNGYGHGCPWSCDFTRAGISYDLDQYKVGIDCVDSCIWLSVNSHRPPNGATQVDAVIKGVRKVFDNLDEVPVA